VFELFLYRKRCFEMSVKFHVGEVATLASHENITIERRSKNAVTHVAVNCKVRRPHYWCDFKEGNKKGLDLLPQCYSG
jgi:hypothetical protein